MLGCCWPRPGLTTCLLKSVTAPANQSRGRARALAFGRSLATSLGNVCFLVDGYQRRSSAAAARWENLAGSVAVVLDCRGGFRRQGGRVPLRSWLLPGMSMKCLEDSETQLAQIPGVTNIQEAVSVGEGPKCSVWSLMGRVAGTTGVRRTGNRAGTEQPRSWGAGRVAWRRSKQLPGCAHGKDAERADLLSQRYLIFIPLVQPQLLGPANLGRR